MVEEQEGWIVGSQLEILPLTLDLRPLFLGCVTRRQLFHLEPILNLCTHVSTFVTENRWNSSSKGHHSSSKEGPYQLL